MPTKFARPAAPLVAAVLAACTRDPIAWNDAAERQALVPPPAAGTAVPDVLADSILRATLHAALPGADDAAAARATVPPVVLDAFGPACSASVRVAAGRGAERDAVWWAQRANGSALLLSSRSGDGGATWDPPVRVDTLDVATTGCDRPAPSVAVDARNGYTHVAYSLVAPEGTGVFYAHRMGPALPFERPLVIVYGDHVTPASVAANGDLVVVAYEDPNTGGHPYVSLALSRTAGHSWDERVPVSSDAESAERPGVALRGRDVAVGWLVPNTRGAPPSGDAQDAGASAGGVVVVRVGRVR